MSRFNIAIDGPSGAGKSTLAKALAADLDMIHLDTGSMYRAIAFLLDKKGIPPQEGQALSEALETVELGMEEQGIRVGERLLRDELRSERISTLASRYAQLPSVRQKLVALQQEIARNGGFILDGRDICDVVLPDAQVKIYLDASVKERARRRWLQDREKGITTETLEEIEELVRSRDEADRNREFSPLIRSESAHYLNTDGLTFEESLEEMKKLVKALQEQL